VNPHDFDQLVERVLVPALDVEQHAGYRELRAFLDMAAPETKEWYRGSAHIRARRDPSIRSGDAVDWTIGAHYEKK
jgi:hypothetical protein